MEYYFNILKCVSTSDDECNRVGLELGTNPKQKASNEEDIVSANSDIWKHDLGYSRVDGTSKMNDAKLAEIADRKSM